MHQIRSTLLWPKLKYYLELLMKVFNENCLHQNNEEKGIGATKYKTEICYWVTTLHFNISNEAANKCKITSGKCKLFCDKYCDYLTKTCDAKRCIGLDCPRVDGSNISNQTEELLPTYKEVDQYLNTFVNKQNCRKK